MLQIFHSIDEIRYSQLMAVYEESNRTFGEKNYPWMSANEQLLESEQELYNYLSSVFFNSFSSFYAVWTVSGAYVCALRAEPYEDGYLINGLETRPDCRKMGYAKSLLREAVRFMKESGKTPVYSHINKRNAASIRVHKASGFQPLHTKPAVLLDGSISNDTITCFI